MTHRPTRSTASSTLAVSELLSIDVDAEVRKLAARQFGQPHEVTIELARWLVRSGAQQIEIVTSRRGVRLMAPGAVVQGEMLATLAEIFDDAVSAERRHELVVRWEARHGTAWLAAMGANETALVSVSASGTHELRRRGGEAPTLRFDAGRRGASSVSVHMRRAVERDVERHGVAQAARFARLPITIDGERVSLGKHAEDCFVAADFSAPGVTGVVGLPRHERHGRSIEVRDELVLREQLVHSPQGFVHVALAYVDPAAPARDELLWRAIRATRDRLYERLATTAGEWPAPELASAKELLAMVALRGGDRRWLEQTPLFTDVEGARATLAELGASARGGSVLYVDPSDAERAGANDLQRVFVLGELEREMVQRWLHLATSPALSAEPRGWVVAGLRAARDELRRVASSLVGWWSGGRVPDEELGAHERALARALERELSLRLGQPTTAKSRAVVTVRFTRRGSLPGRVERGAGQVTLWVPRNDPRVARAARRLAADPGLARWVLFACGGGDDG